MLMPASARLAKISESTACSLGLWTAAPQRANRSGSGAPCQGVQAEPIPDDQGGVCLPFKFVANRLLPQHWAELQPAMSRGCSAFPNIARASREAVRTQLRELVGLLQPVRQSRVVQVGQVPAIACRRSHPVHTYQSQLSPPTNEAGAGSAGQRHAGDSSRCARDCSCLAAEAHGLSALASSGRLTEAPGHPGPARAGARGSKRSETALNHGANMGD